jgi:T4 bacteriophage base plate protein
MEFPKIATPTYDVKLFSRKDPIKIRPFLVKEQKLLMMAVEEKNLVTTVDTIKQIAKNCVIDNINIDDLPMVDLEIIFLNMRARSMGETAKVYFKCKNVVETEGVQGTCGMLIDLDIDLLNVPVINTDSEKNIKITDTIGVQMKYPTFSVLRDIVDDANIKNNDSEFRTAAMCIEYIYDKDSVYYTKDATVEETMDFIYSLPPESYEKIANFIKRLPTIGTSIDKSCPKCGVQHNFVLEGLNDFFI